MRRAVLVLMSAAWIISVVGATAVEPDEVLPNPALEARARALSADLRCMVCQNQSIDDSNAPLARDLRILVRERIAAGDSDSEVVDFLVARYGEFILLKPRFNLHTAFLWAVAPVALIVGGIVAIFVFRRRRSTANAAPLDEAEKRQLAAILDADRQSHGE
jgi:cytochrome c-type biogenesis protein CcmH